MHSRGFFILLFLFPLCFFAQTRDKNWHLLDSVNYEKIEKNQRLFMDSVLALYHAEKRDTVKIDLLLSLAEAIEDNRIWIQYNRLALRMAEQGGEGKVYLRHKASALNNEGFYAQTMGDNKEAIELYSRSLSLREKLNDKDGIANSLNNLGYVFDELGDLEKAEDYYRRAMKIREETGERTGMVNSLNNLGTLYYEKKDFKQAAAFYERSLKLAKEIKFKKGIGSALNNLGNVYSEFGDHRKALAFQEAALQYKEETLDAKGLCGTYLNFANIYEEMGDEKKVKEYADKAMVIAQEKGFPESIRDASWTLFRYYRRSKQFESALDMHMRYIRMRDSVNNESIRRASVKQQFKYEYEKKEAALRSEQNKKDAIAEADRKRQDLFLALLGAIALAIGVVAIVVIRSLRITRKQKRIIELQKHLVEEKQKEILDSIHYAKRIQRTLLTSELYIEKNLKKLRK